MPVPMMPRPISSIWATSAAGILKKARHQPNAEAFRKQFAAVREASSSSGASPDEWLAAYDANTVELV